MPPPSAPSRFLILGDSNGNGWESDPTWDGQPVPGGWVIRTAGSTVANYPTGPSPSPATIPYLIAGTDAPGGWVIRRSVSGASAARANTNAQVASALLDVATLADGGPDVVLIYLGANDDTPELIAAFDANMRGLAALIRWYWPNAHIVYLGEGGPDPHLPTNRAVLAALAADPYLGGSYVDGSGLDLIPSGVHWSAAGHEALGALISDLWSPP